MNYFEGFQKIKYYIIAVSVFFAVYVWAGVTGTRLIGDDNDSKEEPNGKSHSSGNGFYHK